MADFQFLFELGKVYRRRDLHDQFGGQRQGGIVTPTSEPLIFLITGDAGLGYGYHDEEHEDGTFLYYGEGQSGDMAFVRGNRSVRDHALDGRDLYLFRKVQPAHLRYLGQYVCAGFELVPDVPDVNDLPRTAIAFQLLPIVADDADEQLADAEVSGLSLDDNPTNIFAFEFPASAIGIFAITRIGCATRRFVWHGVDRTDISAGTPPVVGRVCRPNDTAVFR